MYNLNDLTAFKLRHIFRQGLFLLFSHTIQSNNRSNLFFSLEAEPKKITMMMHLLLHNVFQV